MTVLTVALLIQCCVCLSVCHVSIVAKRCLLSIICLKKKIGNNLLGIERSRDRRYVTLKGQGHAPHPICLGSNISKIAVDAI